MMKSSLVRLCLLGMVGAVSACSFMARSPEDYQKDTAALLETKSADIKQCYDTILQSNQAAQGTVAVRFTVEKKTGSIISTALEPSATTAPPEVADCVLSSISSLALDPPDAREGQAMFVWEFTATQSAPAPGAEPAAVDPAAAAPAG